MQKKKVMAISFLLLALLLLAGVLFAARDERVQLRTHLPAPATAHACLADTATGFCCRPGAITPDTHTSLVNAHTHRYPAPHASAYPHASTFSTTAYCHLHRDGNGDGDSNSYSFPANTDCTRSQPERD